ncbi:MAG TPA: serine/threonine-protein kinase [Rudaea sp.]|nr:serine/threonine-protein kinase [Rudaea sp.]
MDTQRWQRIGAVFDEVVEAAPEARAALLDGLCGDDADLRREVRALLAADAVALDFDGGGQCARNFVAADWADADERDSVRIDERFGPWRVLRELGRGGMGVVWLAERADGQFEQRAALKLIKRGMDSDAVLARFLRERQILARLEHPHIARLLDGGLAADSRPYFAMEYIDGLPLLRYCTEHGAILETRIGLFLDICAAVQFAHGQLVVHRDIKPSNVLVTVAGEAKLLDFGIAKLLDDPGGREAATVDALHRPVTAAYAAPEQLRGEAETTATDTYALGCVLYELLTGKRPLATSQAPTAEAMRQAQDTTCPVAPSRVSVAESPVVARSLRGDLDTITLKALQREPHRRYATVAAFADDLQSFLAGLPISARRDQAGYRIRKFVGRHRFGVGAVATGVLLLIAALGLALWQAQAKAREAQVSQQVTQFLVGLFSGANPMHAQGTKLSAEDLLDQGTQRLRANTGIDATVRARLLQTVAVTYTGLGLYDQALPLARQALDLRRVHADRVELAESQLELGRVLRLKFDYARAEPLLREALRTRLARLPPDDPAISDSYDELGLLLRARGDFVAAEAQFRAARESAERHAGAGAIDTARYLDDYAANLDDLGKRSEALELYRRTLAIREKSLGPDDADVAASQLNLGVHLDESGRYTEAEPLLQRALAVRRKIFGTRHPLVGVAEIGLAGVYVDQNKLAQAEKLGNDALAIFRQTLPPDHPQISEALNLLVVVRVEQRDFANAVPLAQEVLTRYTKTLGAEHPDTLTAKNNLAFALLHVGRLAEAETLQRDVLARKHRESAQLLDATDSENLANTLVQEHKFAEAVIYARQAVDIQKHHEGQLSGNTAVALRGLGIAEQLNGSDTDAERDLAAALAIGNTLHVTQDIDMFQWRLPLADFFVGTHKCEQARPMLDAVVAELKPRMPLRDAVPLRQAQLLLGHCLIRQGSRTQGESMLAAARKDLHALPSIEMDLYPTARKLLSASPHE